MSPTHALTRPRFTYRTRLSRPKSHRLDGIDLARALAIIGMFYMHTWGHLWGDNLLRNAFDGRSSILFAVLAGVSVVLLTKSRDTLTSVLQLVGRGIILVLIGLAISLDSVGPIVILVTYGFLYILVAPLVFRLNLFSITIAAAASALFLPLFSFEIRRMLPDPPGFGAIPTLGHIENGQWSEFWQYLFITGLFPLMSWIPVFLAGVAAGKFLFATDQAARWLVVIGAPLFLLGYGGSWLYLHLSDFHERYSAFHPDGAEATDYLLNNAPGVTPTDWYTWLFLYVPHSGSIAEILSSTGLALFIIGLCLIACRNVLFNDLVYPLRDLGKMPLTAYVGHILAIGYLNANGHNMAEPQYALANLLGPIVFAMIWFRLFRRGPIEQLMYWALKPLSRVSSLPAPRTRHRR
ncbi:MULTISPECIES: DUF418 domain-containing protein [unclassified Corynebacterium]|uniref:DUF418 domain-containing protein n=1 Tax=unclassified Corynebacterium TaxID=2624378 RepID=UPI0029C9F6A0|nr:MULTISPECIES: DUF418 domain-containing protein [unclassified Corynebacterium]WPF66617.1 DUF418 domain-containing protein [Corynebacterium sp. 22KM0430]WPF69105.1 DUF418 domain-containing protein [Corynebacterium sp. 21KM1197]